MFLNLSNFYSNNKQRKSVITYFIKLSKVEGDIKYRVKSYYHIVILAAEKGQAPGQAEPREQPDFVHLYSFQGIMLRAL